MRVLTVEQGLFEFIQPGTDFKPKLGNTLFHNVDVKAFLEPKSEAGDIVVQQFGTNRQGRFLVQNTVKRLPDILLDREKSVPAQVLFGYQMVGVNLADL